MYEWLSILLGPPLQLFYPLLIASIITFIYGIGKRSWIALMISGIVLFPDALYFSGYPRFFFSIIIPIIIVAISIVMYRKNKKKIRDSF